MRLVRYCVLVASLLTAAVSFAQKEDWLPVTPQDLQMKEVPGQPGASAVRLYYANYIDDNLSTEFNYYRIKILTSAALTPPNSYADVQIEMLPGVTISDLKARTIKPDGSIVDFIGKPFEKTIFKGRGLKAVAKAFTLPEVSVGSIVEYKYKLSYLNSPFFSFSTDVWVMQSNLYTVKEHLYFKPFEGGGGRGYWEEGGAQVASVSSNLKQQPKSKGNNFELELQDIPAFEAEEFMPPENNYKPVTRFFYTRIGNTTADKGWQELAKNRYEDVETFLSKNKGVKEAAAATIGDETEPGMKLRKLYEKAQQLRNLTYERDRTKEEAKKENLKGNTGVSDVLKRGYGGDDEITLAFVAMARAAGFDVAVLQAGNRKEGFFNKEWTSLSQLDTMVALVNVGGAELYLEPGAKFCPYGMVRWTHTGSDALKLEKKGGAFVKIPTNKYDKAVTHRSAVVSVAENGDLKGEITLEFKGLEALEHRLDAIDEDEAGRKKSLEDELFDSLPKEASVKAVDVQGWNATDDPLVAKFHVEIPSYASIAGKRLLIPSYLFRVKQNAAFKQNERKYPVYFPYPFSETDEVSIKVPAGFSVESVPGEQEARLSYAGYQSVSNFDGSQLLTQRQLLFNAFYIDLSRYAEVKGFFNKVQTGDEQQAILQNKNAGAQKGN